MPIPTATTSSSNRALKTCQVILFKWSILSRLDYKIMAFRRAAQRMLSGCRKINLAHKGITEYLGLEGTQKSNFMPSPASYWRFRLHFSRVPRNSFQRDQTLQLLYSQSFLSTNQLKKPTPFGINTQKERWATNQMHLKSNREILVLFTAGRKAEADKLF